MAHASDLWHMKAGQVVALFAPRTPPHNVLPVSLVTSLASASKAQVCVRHPRYKLLPMRKKSRAPPREVIICSQHIMDGSNPPQFRFRSPGFQTTFRAHFGLPGPRKRQKKGRGHGKKRKIATATGFEPMRAVHSRFQVYLLNHSDKLSTIGSARKKVRLLYYSWCNVAAGVHALSSNNKNIAARGCMSKVRIGCKAWVPDQVAQHQFEIEEYL